MRSLKRSLPYLLALLCLVAGAVYLSGSYRSFHLSDDMVSPWEEHTKLIRQALPPDVLVIGYVDNSFLPDSHRPYDEAEFFMTQYGLAPVVIVAGLEHDWIIGNFGNTVALEDITPWLDETLGSYTIQDMGFGIYLIRDTGE